MVSARGGRPPVTPEDRQIPTDVVLACSIELVSSSLTSCSIVRVGFVSCQSSSVSLVHRRAALTASGNAGSRTCRKQAGAALLVLADSVVVGSGDGTRNRTSVWRGEC